MGKSLLKRTCPHEVMLDWEQERPVWQTQRNHSFMVKLVFLLFLNFLGTFGRPSGINLLSTSHRAINICIFNLKSVSACLQRLLVSSDYLKWIYETWSCVALFSNGENIVSLDYTVVLSSIVYTIWVLQHSEREVEEWRKGSIQCPSYMWLVEQEENRWREITEVNRRHFTKTTASLLST